jgi:transcriptional regulator
MLYNFKQGTTDMRRRPREPEAPVERYQTIRRRIMELLAGTRMTAKEISEELRVPERDVYDHLDHIRKTTNKGKAALVVGPAACEACGFVFTKRGRLKTPGKCPMCRSESIRQAVFSVETR